MSKFWPPVQWTLYLPVPGHPTAIVQSQVDFMKSFGGDGCPFSLKASKTNTCVYVLHYNSGELQLWPYRLTVLWMQNKPRKEQQRFYPLLRIRKRSAACSARKSNIPERNCWVRDLQGSEDSSQHGKVILGLAGHFKWLVSNLITDNYSDETKQNIFKY